MIGHTVGYPYPRCPEVIIRGGYDVHPREIGEARSWSSTTVWVDAPPTGPTGKTLRREAQPPADVGRDVTAESPSDTALT